MKSVLAILIATALLCGLSGYVPGWARPAKWLAAVGAFVAFAAGLLEEAVAITSLLPVAVTWPRELTVLDTLIYRTDALSAALGIWCLLLGALCLLRVDVAKDDQPTAYSWRLCVALLTIATLYSLVHTWHLAVFAAHVLLLFVLASAYQALGDRISPRQTAAMGLAAIALLGAVALVGRTTGEQYDLLQVSLSALTIWPLLLVITFTVLWLGLAPATGWSGEIENGGYAALLQALVLGIPVFVLLMRLEELVSAQSIAGNLPEQWHGATTALMWLAGGTALVAGAGTILHARSTRWMPCISALVLSLGLWGLALDSPAGRYAALAVLLAFSASRVGYALSPVYGSGLLWRAVATASLLSLPLTAGFVGLWLLATALAQTGHPSTVVVLAGAAILAGCGGVLHRASRNGIEEKASFLLWVSGAWALLLLTAGILPRLWLPAVADMARVAGGSTANVTDWPGPALSGLSAAVLLLAGAVLLLAVVALLIRVWTRPRTATAGVLLATAIERLQDIPTAQEEAWQAQNPPFAVWWLSLQWLEDGIWDTGVVLGRLGRSIGWLTGRLEGRFYLPLALIGALLFLLVVAR